MGDYTDSEIAQDFNYKILYSHNSADIVKDTINGSSTKVMRITHEANKIGVGFEMYVDLGKDYDELYLSFNWQFSDEFNATAGGKLPGLGGLPDFEGYPGEGDGFRAHNLFKYAGQIASYHYDRTKAIVPWGVDEDSIYMVNGTWYNITQRLVMNTFTNGVANADGIKELWINGKLVIQENNIKLMQDQRSDMKIDLLVFSNFFGGDGASFLPQNECYGYIDNISVYMPTSDPVTGRRLHELNKIIRTPDEITDRDFVYDRMITSSGVMSNSQYGSTYSSCRDETYLIDAGNAATANYVLKNYSIGGGDMLFFYDGNTADSKLITVIKGSVSSTGSKTISSTGRYLFVRFSSNNSEESAGWTGIVSFKAILPPDAPSSLKVNEFSQKSVAISWQDNSNNEDNFVISRCLLSDPGNCIEKTVNVNDTSFRENDLEPGKTYIYDVKAINTAGSSACNTKCVVATLSELDLKRHRQGIIALYNFSYNAEMKVYDVSGFGEPLNLNITHFSSVEWPYNQELKIESSAYIVSSLPAKKIIDAVRSTNEITFECWIKPDEPGLNGISNIMSLGGVGEETAFALTQNFNNGANKKLYYSARLNTASTNSSGFPELKEQDLTAEINLHHLVYVRKKDGNELIYIDGKKAAEGFRPGDFSTWTGNYFLRIGNDSDLNNPWAGTFYMVAIYKNALTEEQVIQNYEAGPKDFILQKGIQYDFKAYPNPVYDNIMIDVVPLENADVIAPAYVRILDINGKILYNKNIFNPYVPFKELLNFPDNFVQGIYFIQLVSGDRQQMVKLIKK